MNRANQRRQRTPQVRPVCISRQWRGAAAADRFTRFTRMRRNDFTFGLLVGVSLFVAAKPDCGSLTFDWRAA